MAIVDELITLLGFDVDDAGARQFNSAMTGIKNVAAAVGAAIVTAEGAVLAYTNKIAGATDELGKFTASQDFSSTRLQQFEFATERAGGSTEDLRADIAALTKNLASPIPGEFNQGLFLLGVNVRNTSGELKNAEEILLELSDRFSGLDAKQRQILATQAGLSESTLRFIAQGREEIERLSAKAVELGGILPPEATIIAAEYADRLTDVNFALSGIGKTVAISLLPNLTRGLERFEDWIIVNREFITQKVEAVVTGIGKGFEIVFNAIDYGLSLLKNAFPSLEGLSDKIDYARLIAISFVSVIGILAVAFSPLLIKIAAISAAVAGLIIIIDDFVAFVNGQKSLIGTFLDNFLEKFPLAKFAIDNLKKFFENFAKGIGPLIGSIGLLLVDIFKYFSDSATVGGRLVQAVINDIIVVLNIAIGIINNVIDVFSALIALFLGDFKAAGEIIKSLLGRNLEFVLKVFNQILTAATSLIDKVGEFTGLWGAVSDMINAENISKAGEAIGVAANSLVGKTKNFLGDQLESLSMVGDSIGKAADKLVGEIDLTNFAVELKSVFNLAATPAFAGVVPAPVAGNTFNNQNREINQTNNNTYNINGAQSPQAVANAIANVNARQQSSLSTAAQVGAYPGLE